MASGKRFPALIDKVKLKEDNAWDVTSHTHLEALMATTFDEAVETQCEDDFTFLKSRLPSAWTT